MDRRELHLLREIGLEDAERELQCHQNPRVQHLHLKVVVLLAHGSLRVVDGSLRVVDGSLRGEQIVPGVEEDPGLGQLVLLGVGVLVRL